MGVIERDPAETRIPLVFPIASRDTTLTKDSLMRNVYVDIMEDGRRFVTKRPGVVTYTNVGGGGVGTGQGAWFYNNFLITATDNVLTRVVSPTSTGHTVGTAW